ncbi:hypothetical protein TorRG33x02_177180 [Trema orientale]|uniref:Uncharacterized protein n=1 Tax=Trema orientale TaxID=63057 RepID=A0A2P5ELT4_TREOI|nr:hypothetical protein TorRG33x02_177180 [Trema orientale]
MPVFITGTISIEEQLQELRRRLVEKEAKIECLTTQLAKQASISKLKKMKEGQFNIFNNSAC